MNPLRHFMMAISMAALILPLSSPAQAAPPAPAPAGEPIAAKLADARLKYENEMENIRTSVLAALEKEDDNLRAKPDADLKALADLKAKREAFISSGEWPSIEAIRPLSDRRARAFSALVGAYKAAKNGYIQKEKRDDLAKAVLDESEQLAKESDIVPWGKNLVNELGAKGTETVAEKQVFDTGETASQAYRIEIVGKRIDGEGPLGIALPTPGGKTIQLTANAGDKGDIRVLLSVRDALSSADYGVPRPLPAAADTDDPGELALWADKAKFTVESIRLKPILDAKPELAAAPNPPPKGKSGKPATNKPQKEDPSARLVQGSVWTGQRITGDGKSRPEPEASVKSRNGNEIILVTERLDGHGKLLRTIRIGPEGKLIPTGMIAKGGPLGNFSVEGGRGWVHGDKLTLHTVGTWSGPKGGANNRFEDTLNLELK